eukprot:3782342-Prymnesium_polylepis.1
MAERTPVAELHRARVWRVLVVYNQTSAHALNDRRCFTRCHLTRIASIRQQRPAGRRCADLRSLSSSQPASAL